MRRILPLLLAAWLSAAEGDPTLVLREWNLGLEPAPGWSRVRAEGGLKACLRTKDGNALVEIDAFEGSAMPSEDHEAVISAIGMSYGQMRQLGDGPEPVLVAGAPGRTSRWSAAKNGTRVVIRVLVFSHQGICYRIFLTRTTARGAAVDRDMDEMVDSISFLGERTAWLERHRGRPWPALFAGGMVSATLARPRWGDVTMKTSRDHGALDQAGFGLMSGGAWLHVRVRRARGDAQAELEAARARIVADGDGGVEAVTDAAGSIPGLSFDLVDAGSRMRYRVGATVAHGVAVVAWMAAVEDRVAETADDWAGFTTSLAVAGDGFLYDPRPRDYAAGAGAIAGAVRIPNTDASQLWLSGDGEWAVARQSGVVTRVSLRDGRHEPLLLGDAAILDADADAHRTAVATGEAVVVVAAGATRSLPVAASAIALVPGSSGAVVCAGPDQERSASGLWHLDLFSGATRALAARPFTHWSLPAVAGDGRRAAAVAADAVGDAATTALIMVPIGDPGAPATVREGVQDFRSLAWTLDGRLLAVRHGHRSVDGRSLDCLVWWTEAIATGDGTIQRLTPDHIGFSAAMAGNGDLILWPQFWSLPTGDQVLHRLPAARIAALPPGPSIDAGAVRDAVRTAMSRWLATRPPETAAGCARGAEVVVAAWEAAGGGAFPLSGTAPGEIHALQRTIAPGVDPDPILVLATALVYGEQAVRAGRAEWAVGPGAWEVRRPAPPPMPAATTDWVAPYQVVWWTATDDDGYMEAIGSPTAPALLVHPPAAAADLLRARVPAPVLRARAAVARRDAEAAVAAYAEALVAEPRADRIAQEALAAAQASGIPDAPARLGATLLAAGGSHPRLLMAVAAGSRDPVPALMRAAGHRDADSEVFRALARSASAAAPALAEMALRRAWRLGGDETAIAGEMAAVHP